MTLKELFDKTVFFIGAGASVDAECLSSNDMLVELRTSILQLKDENKKKYFLGIYEFILSSLSYQNMMKNPNLSIPQVHPNIEDFVMILRQLIDREYIVPSPLVGNWNEKIVSWETLWNKNNEDGSIFKSFLSFITHKLISSWTKFDSQKSNELLSPLKQLLFSAEQFDINVFSLNYDLIFESNFNSRDEQLIDIGFSKDEWVGDFDDKHSPARLKLYKLHGSVDWYFDRETEKVKSSNEALENPLIIFGSNNKMQSYDPFISLLSKFREKLKNASLFIIIGYSFFDKYINNILIQSLSSEMNRLALIVDPKFNNESKIDFLEKIEKVQNSRSLNDIINLTKINQERVQTIPLTALGFLKDYLGNDAAKLKEILSNLQEGEQLF